MSTLKQLPGYVYLTPHVAERYAEQTRRGLYKLMPFEVEWSQRQDFLAQRGYDLRTRYLPNWKPSWIGTNLAPDFCEDSIALIDPRIMDATRRSDGLLVAIKIVSNNSQKLQIAQYLSSITHPDNHCVSVLDALPDPLGAGRSLLVMPFLRQYNDPELTAVGEAIHFVTQMLEGLAFIHGQSVAHRDIGAANVMMDPSPIYPNGFHPVQLSSTPDVIDDPKPLSRLYHPVNYFYIDFGLSVRFAPGAPPYVSGRVGRDPEIFEMSWTVPYDGFKADIFALGNLFDKELEQLYGNLGFLRPLIECMKQEDPDLRPSAPELVKVFKQIRALQPDASYHRRLGPKTEGRYEKLFNDTVAVARGSIDHLKRMMG